jgi:cation diffusion facilitator CzcD-associated flavoprotein CzcO
MPDSKDHNTRDAIIIGAGVCGIYMLHKLLECGMDATVLDAAERPGGTWNKNRYPGARFDSESYSYGYSFSEEIMQEWDWSEQFAGQPETLRYLTYVVDKLGIRDHMQFNCLVTAARYDETRHCWHVDLADGSTLSARYLLTAVGLLSAPTKPRFEGMSCFEGESFHTYEWPEDLDYANKRVAVIGTGATGVQIISEIHNTVSELKVFQRRPNWCAPLKNSPIEDQAALKASYPELQAKIRSTLSGFVHEPKMVASTEVSKEEREAFWEELYDQPGFGIWLGNYYNVLLDEPANREFSEFIAKKIRQRVDDPVTAEKLIPTDHGFGTRRVPLETRYFEAYNNPKVELIDINETPIERITPSGIKTSAQDYQFDIIVYATGFDAITGAFDLIDIAGRGGEKLKDKWRDDPLTYLGLQVVGFPNLFTLAGPQSASVGSNFPPAIQSVVEWTCELIQYLDRNRIKGCEPSVASEQHWQNEVKFGYEKTLLGTAKSWFTGYNSNVDGHDKLRHLVYFNGAPKLRESLGAESENGYPGFELQA